ncbi:MAG TPA: twin-arginine translocation signal domain-containing protein [Terriglobales bacterium]|nr:twin-arginine translocation signal domain-containing protein [Terriglobales bacterium]
MASNQAKSKPSRAIRRRSFLKGLGVAGAAVSAGSLLKLQAATESSSGTITQGDAAILRFLAAAEIIESDLWLQYQEFLGVQDDEVSTIASKQIPGYPATPTGGNPAFIKDILILDTDMQQYIHDNTEDELSHETFINAYLVSKGFDPVSLDGFRNLPSSKATGANNVGRLTNLMELTVNTSFWTRYRSSTGNPDLGNTFPPAVPSLAVNKHPQFHGRMKT